MMDDKMIMSIGLALTSALAGWLFKNIWERIARNENSVRELEAKVAKDYQSKEVAAVERARMDELLRDIRDNLRQINHKLDQKADK